MLMRKIIVGLLILWAAVPAWCQKSKLFVKSTEVALNHKVAADFFAKQKKIYDPVIGYIVPIPPMPSHPSGALTAFVSGRTQDADLGRHLMQVAPFKRPLQDVHQTRELVRGDFMTPGQLAQAAYLWQLAHPWHSLQKYPYVYKQVQETVTYARENFSRYNVEELPNLQFLDRMLNPGFQSFSYAKLLELTPVYPKHITLDEAGFPVASPNANSAKLLDVYLMLSNPREMGAFVNVAALPGDTYEKSYRPFVLTKEERLAANELLARRLDSDRLPENPTVRDLIEQAYNRLETHTLPYSQIDNKTPDSFQSYPHYKNTRLYRAIQGTVIGQWPVIWIENGHYVLQNRDTLHLIVLDAVMGGVDWHNYGEVSRVMESFWELCANTTPTPQHIAHLQLLQKNLLLVFKPLLREWAKLTKEPYGLYPENSPLRHIGFTAWDTLVKLNVRDIAGKHL